MSEIKESELGAELEAGIDKALTPECPECDKKMALWTDSGKRTWVCLDRIAGKCAPPNSSQNP